MPQPDDVIRQGNAEIVGLGGLPDQGFLLLPGWLDEVALGHLDRCLAGRPVSYLLDEGAAHEKSMAAALESRGDNLDGFTSGTTGPDELAELLSGKIAGGEIVIYVPGAATTQTAATCAVPTRTLSLLLAAGQPTVPLAATENGRVRLSVEKPNGAAYSLSFGSLLEGDALSLARYREELMKASEAGFSERDLFEENLARIMVRGLKKHAARKVIDGLDGSELEFGKLLAAAIVLSKKIKAETNKDRIAIILPPGKGALLANVAALIAGKTPVNLNFTASIEAIESSVRQADVDRYITADPFVRKLPAFPWPRNRELILLERELPTLKFKIALWLALSKLLPAAALSTLAGVPKKGGDREAVLLFTSGSSGEPKGVVLSHKNILANVLQFGSRLGFGEDDKVLASLPIFHSFGCTVTMCYPLIEGLTVVTYPSPLETKKIAELIAKYRISLLVATPTFLRGYLRRANREQLAPLKLVVTGAEKLPAQLAAAFKKRFGKDVHEGYGLTETSPATNLNLPDPSAEGDREILPSSRPGSVGQPLPGLAISIRHPETGEHLPIDKTGMIWLRGPNVFSGYLNNRKKTEEVIVDGWFCTGDLGRVDDDGFLHIEGRISRFSKIAGEMVPHETLEDAINKAMGLEDAEERKIAVVGVPDEKKGEAIVLLSTVSGDTLNQESIELRYKLIEDGIPSLWTPKKIIPTDEIPVLASGKLDIKGCQEQVNNALESLRQAEEWNE